MLYLKAIRSLLGKRNTRLRDRQHQTSSQTRMERCYSRIERTVFKLLKPIYTRVKKGLDKENPWKKRYEDAERIIRKVPRQRMCATGSSRQLTCKIEINGQRLRALIDLGATVNTMLLRIIAQLDIRTIDKDSPYVLEIINRENYNYNDRQIN